MAKNFLIFALSLRNFPLDITAFIRELLFGHDCVIVPGFGGFIGNYTPARIDKKSGTFYPPVKQISFNRNLNHNDGLLVGRISGTSGINYGDARSIVEEFVIDIRRKLEKGEKIVFDHIGSFINNQEGNIQFEPDPSSNYHLDSYGLESFQLSPLEGYNVRTRIIRPVSKDPQRQASVRKILWRAAVIVPLLSVLVIVPLKTDLFRSKVETTNMNPLVSAEFEQNKKAVDEGVKTDEVKPEEIIPPVVEDKPEVKIVEPVVSETGTYVLITGSFKSEENARSQVNTLKAQGFTPEIVVAPNGFYRVYAIACSDMNTALAKKDSIEAEFPGA
ncbi:MAG: SPOR domain-containing protein [Bacteroidales bacterium]|nr:SPOR domain-containing protein [Bacteroidales bacterium]